MGHSNDGSEMNACWLANSMPCILLRGRLGVQEPNARNEQVEEAKEYQRAKVDIVKASQKLKYTMLDTDWTLPGREGVAYCS